MKKILMFVGAMVVCGARATTVDLNWMVDDAYYTQTTCETGGDLILPTAPTKYGYTFRGWTLVDEIVAGTVTQNGTPAPSNPIYPTFYENNGMILRAVGNIADAYNPATGKITRGIGVKVLDGTEDWGWSPGDNAFFLVRTEQSVNAMYLCSHFQGVEYITGNYQIRGGNGWSPILRYTEMNGNAEAFKQFLATQYANGTPVTIYYQLAESVEEVWSGQ